MDARVRRILDNAQSGKGPSKEECVHLLSFPAHSAETSLVRATADANSRKRFRNEAILLGQIGIEISSCPGACKFCSFGEGHTQFPSTVLSLDEVLDKAKAFTISGDLYSLFLMTMHTFDTNRLCEIVTTLRQQIPAQTQIVANIGDFEGSYARELKSAGVNGAYHVVRLREGKDTKLDPEKRKQTIRGIKESGLDWYYCCEPIGPEHTNEELVEQMFIGVEFGCFQHAAMRRVYIPHAPLAQHGQITELRLGQITAVVALSTIGSPETKNIAVHEPNLIGLTSGANVVYAETGANPRDTQKDTTGNRGLDVAGCKRMLYEAGFETLLTSPSTRRPLNHLTV